MIDPSAITVADFKAFFVRDFNYYSGHGCSREFVTDDDIARAFNETQCVFNQGLFGEETPLRMAYYYCAAHHLAIAFQMAAQGLASVGHNAVVSRSVGGVSESYQVPTWCANDPVLSSFATTRYGQKYLSMIRPLMIGNAVVFQGATTPY